MLFSDLWQEFRELGPRRTAFRLGWEARLRLGITGRIGARPASTRELRPGRIGDRLRRLSFGDPVSVAVQLRNWVDAEALLALAREELRGRVRCFGSWMADFGFPPDWHRNPATGGRWNAEAHWTLALRDTSREGDIKFTWEIGRFPHAYRVARAAAFSPEVKTELAEALLQQIRGFVAANPYGRGVHWSSGQEIILRLMAWLFALDVLLSGTPLREEAEDIIADSLLAAATYVEAHIDYSRLAVYNNHLLSEALGLLIAGTFLPEASRAAAWHAQGRGLLEVEADRQFYPDGSYIQQSHNYHRVALQNLLWACLVARAGDDAPAGSWLRAMERSLDFLVAHQNLEDGRLPNYGSNDGALPSILSTCDFADFRPTLQVVSLLTRGERLYPPGPWDEEAAWFLGPKALDAPLRPATRKSVSFAGAGHHVLRGHDPGTFGAFRCGTLRDRFSQIDMLHLDVWWRGSNVLVDGGSYLYNGSPELHNHFMRTASHNTVQLDERDQMLHLRQFKVVYWTKAKLLCFEDHPEWVLCSGEHYGYHRHPGACVHRRSVLLIKDDLWIVADRIDGEGAHRIRLHWLGGEFPHSCNPKQNAMSLETPAGSFNVQVLDENGLPLEGSVVSGQENPPRGWLSRYYGKKTPVPSLVVQMNQEVPITLVSLLSAGNAGVAVHGDAWIIEQGENRVGFRLRQGLFHEVSIGRGNQRMGANPDTRIHKL
jgi:hypothetical protein